MCVPTTKLKKKPESSKFFFEGSSIKSTKKNKVSSIKEKPRKLGVPPQEIISKLLMNNTKIHVQIKEARRLPESLRAKRKNGIVITEKTNEATIFNAVNSSKILRNISSRTKKIGLCRSPHPLKSFPRKISTCVR